MQQRRVNFHTLGCKLNFSESSTLAREFEEGGFVEWNNQRSLGTEKIYKMAVQFQGKNPWYQWNCR